MSPLYKVILESLTLQSDLKGVVLAVASILQIDKREAVERVKALPLVLAENCSETQARLMGDMLRGMGAGVGVTPPLPSLAVEVGPSEEGKPRRHRRWRTWVMLGLTVMGLVGLLVAGGVLLLLWVHPTPEKSRDLLHQGKIQEARQSLKKQLRHSPDDVELLVQQGQLYLGIARRKMDASGWEGYGEGTRIPDSGTDLLRLPEADSALEVLQRAAARDPKRGDVQRLISLVYQQKGLFHDAEIAARRAVELEPGDVDNWNQLGVVLVELEQYGPAEQALYSALKVRGDDPGAIKNLGILNLYHNRDTVRAAAFLIRYLGTAEGVRDMDRHLLRKDLARAMFGQFNPPLRTLLPDSLPFAIYEQRRRRLAERADGLDNSQVQEELGVLYTSRSMFEPAEACLIRATKLNPGQESAWRMLALLQFMKGNFDQTTNTLRAAARTGNRDPFIYRNLGMMEKYWKADPEAAEKAWNQYLGLAGDSWVDRVRRELGK